MVTVFARRWSRSGRRLSPIQFGDRASSTWPADCHQHNGIRFRARETSALLCFNWVRPNNQKANRRYRSGDRNGKMLRRDMRYYLFAAKNIKSMFCHRFNSG
jgi:hypothetical protein